MKPDLAVMIQVLVEERRKMLAIAGHELITGVLFDRRSLNLVEDTVHELASDQLRCAMRRWLECRLVVEGSLYALTM